jgi:hypothetical protein
MRRSIPADHDLLVSRVYFGIIPRLDDLSIGIDHVLAQGIQRGGDERQASASASGGRGLRVAATGGCGA